MRKPHGRSWFLGPSLVLLLAMFVAGEAGTDSPGEQRSGTPIPGRYIVVLQEGVSPAEVAADHGLAPTHVYRAALNGFATPASPAQAHALGADPRVRSVEPDRSVTYVPPYGPPVAHTQLHESTTETLTTGIDRIDAELNPRTDVSSVGIAIIDTGIWQTHVDLNVAGGYNCTGKDTSKWNDDNGHGTHVAGIAAAKTGDNKGVRGVAPKARLFGVKVLNKSGMGFLSWVICGVNWVTENAPQVKKNIKVANMSLGGEFSSSALDTAIYNSVGAGVTYTVAAGNSSKDASTFSPANHPAVITVSAMGDSDGQCGGTGENTSDGPDDSFASFSNFGPLVEIAAPGVDILSTWKGDKQNPGGLYATASGTSMAAPHVAGAAAQYIASTGAGPAAVRDALITAGVPQHNSCVGDGKGGFSGDPDHNTHPSSLDEPLVYAKDL